MPRNAKILNATQQVLEFGSLDFTSAPGWNGATMTQVAIADDAAIPVVNGAEIPLKYTKVVAQQFVEMTAPEKAIVDAATPTLAVQRGAANAEQQTTSGHASDATTGWVSAIGGVKTALPLVGGDWQLIVALELALLASASWNNTGPLSAAQARIVWNGTEIYNWLWPHPHYCGFSVPLGATIAEGVRPTIDIQFRRFGLAATARVRRIRYELAPTTGSVAFT